MKRFILSVLCVSVFFAGLGALVEKAGAKFRSDERALELIKKARVAIGGDAAINTVQSMHIVGRTTKTIKIDGVEKVHQGETEIAMQLPDKLMKIMKINDDTNASGDKMIDKQVDVVVVGDAKTDRLVTVDAEASPEGKTVKRVIVKKDDGTVQELSGLPKVEGDTKTWTTADGKTFVISDKHAVAKTGDHSAMRQNELLRLTFALLLSAPQGLDVTYRSAGEMSVDGTACNIVVAEFGGSSFRLYLGQTSNLPVMMTYSGHKMPAIMRLEKETATPNGGEPARTVVMRKTEMPAGEMAEFTVKFSDYRSVSGVSLPHRWTQTVGGAADEVFDVTSYEINPTNIAEKFQNQKVMVRTKKPEVQ